MYERTMELPGRWLAARQVSYGVVHSNFQPIVDVNHVPSSEEAGDGDIVERELNPHQIPLEVGDEVYVFEVFKPDLDAAPIWYRGYAVSTSPKPRMPAAVPDITAFPSTTTPNLTEEPQVSVGIFPASYVQIRESVDDAESRLPKSSFSHSDSSSSQSRLPNHRDFLHGRMEPLPEEDEDQLPDSVGDIAINTGRTSPATKMKHRTSVASISSFANQLSSEQQASFKSSRLSFHSGAGPYANGIQQAEEEGMIDVRPAPPLPNLKCGDETASGLDEPLIDEIACALREWASLLYTHLYRKDYTLFESVKTHIEALHSGRRQLLVKTLSKAETDKLRRELVARLVQGNVEQGLDVIVRHPTWGGLVDVGVEGQIEKRAWTSVVKMYAMQVALAYSGAESLTNPSSSASIIAPAPGQQSAFEATAAHAVSSSRFSEANLFASANISDSKSAAPLSTAAKFHHVYVDIRNFAATPCSPGETIELYFSLFNKTDARYVTEEWCVMLDHLGQISQGEEDRQHRLRTLFVDLSHHDVQDQLFLVCRLVKNGALRSNVAEGSSSTQSGSIRRPSFFPNGSGPPQINNDVAPLNGQSPSNVDLSLVENGGMLLTDDLGRTTYRRPFGCAVLEISQFNNKAYTNETPGGYLMPIFVPVHESNFCTMHEHIISSRIKEIERSPRAESVSVDVRIFYGEVASLEAELPQLLSEICLTKRLGFPDVVYPGDQRNEVYLKLWNGNFTVASGTTGTSRSLAQLSAATGGGSKNIEVTAEVRSKDGQVVDRAISRGTGAPNVSQFCSLTFKSNNSPTWGELVKLEVPVELMEQCHVFFTFRSRGSKDRQIPVAVDRPFAFAYLPLFLENSAFQNDGSHKLVLYKYDQSIAVPGSYFKAPSKHDAESPTSLEALPQLTNKTLLPLKDTFIVRSFLVSTKFTQNEVLLKLLRWETELADDPDALKDILTKLRFCSEVEVCKFLRSIFDALFSILMSSNNSGGELDDLVFQALVTILGIISDRRFQNFRPVLDVYIDRHFANSSASSHIIGSLQTLLKNPTASDTGTILRAAIKVWHYLFKFVVKSREIQRAKDVGSGVTSDHLETTFKRELSTLLSQMNSLMRASTPSSIIGAQTLAVQHFGSILPDLAKCFNSQELADIAVSFCDSITAKGKMALWKTLLQSQLVNSVVFTTSHGRAALVPNIVRWLKPSIGRFDEALMCSPKNSQSTRDNARVSWVEGIRLAVSVVASMLDTIHNALVDPLIQRSRTLLGQEQDNVEYLLALLPKLLDSYRELENVANLDAISRQRSTASVVSPTPTVFPSSYPFSLLSSPPSTTSRQKKPNSHPFDPTEGAIEERPSSLQGGVGEIACVFIALLHLAPRKIFVNWLESALEVESKDKFAQMLAQIFRIARSILTDELPRAYPPEWLNISILAHQAIVGVLEPIAAVLEREFVPPQQTSYKFNTSLWRDFFAMLLRLLGSSQLLIEEFSPQKRRAVWRLAGDIRGEGSKYLIRLWNAIGWPEDRLKDANIRTGGYQVQFVPGLVGDVLSLCLSHHDEMRKTAVQVLFSMIVSEYVLNDDFKAIEAEVIDRLDKLFMSQTKGDEISRAFFVSQLKVLFDEANIEAQLRQQVDSFLGSVNSFLDLLLAVRNLPEGEEYQEDRIISTLKLMSFIRGIGRSEIFVRYVDRLVTCKCAPLGPYLCAAYQCAPNIDHVALGNQTEAGLTLMLHADLHTWDLSTFVDALPDLGLPRQTAFARKETLYMRILEHLTKGKAWETALALCKELQQEYETKVFNYYRLSELLVLQSELYANIVKGDRRFGDFFRVAFFGTKFPRSVSGKQFIYRGAPNEKLSAFTERMLNKHPGASLLKASAIPPEDIQLSDTQLLQITSVSAEPDPAAPMLANPDVPLTVKTYYQHNETHMFAFQRPVLREPEERTRFENEFTSQWIEKTILICEDSFPSVLRRSEVVELRIIEISPIENAVQEVVAKRQELDDLQRRYSAISQTSIDRTKINTNVLSMALNSVVDAPPESGVSMYRRAFLAPDYAAVHPDKVSFIHKLETEIDELVMTIGRCLKLHAVLCPPEMKPFHDTLENFFEHNFAAEIARLPEQTFDAAEFAVLESTATSTIGSNATMARFPTRANGGVATSVAPVLRTQGSITVSAITDPMLVRRQSEMSVRSSNSSVHTLTPKKREPTLSNASRTAPSLSRTGSFASTVNTRPLDPLTEAPASPTRSTTFSFSSAKKRVSEGDIFKPLSNVVQVPLNHRSGVGNGGRNSVFGSLWKRKGSSVSMASKD